MSGPPRPQNSRRFWYWLLAVPLIATAFPQFYAQGGPSLAGIPFFYWYQLAWTVLAGVVTGIVYYATREPAK
jgi:uncharacterized protein DUF3311